MMHEGKKGGGQVFASHAWSLEKTFVPEIKKKQSPNG